MNVSHTHAKNHFYRGVPPKVLVTTGTIAIIKMI